MSLNKRSLPILIVLVLFSQNVLASGTISHINEFKLKPQAAFWAFTGDDSFAMAQGMLPIYQGIDHNFFVVGETADGEGGVWFAGVGAGYRMLTNNDTRIFGAYILGDNDTSDNKNRFWVVNPGLESLGELWDFRTNGYFPVGSRTKVRQEGIFSDLNDYSHVINHDNPGGGFSQFDEQYQEIEETGYGGDLEVGRTIPQWHDLKIYAGGYFFGKFAGNPNNIEGAEARINLPLNEQFSVEARDSYDNYKHNTYLLGIKIRLGNFNKKENKRYGIAARLMDPIEHESEVFAMAPSKKQIIGTQEYKTIFDNAYAFIPGSANGGDGTFENPYKGISPEIMQEIIAKSTAAGKNNTQLLFASGSYYLNLFTVGARKVFDDYQYSNFRLNLPENFSMYGREANYTKPASVDNRALFFGGIDINGGNTFDSIRLLNDGNQTGFNDFGIAIFSPTSIDQNINTSFNNVDVGISANNKEQYNKAVELTIPGGILNVQQIVKSNFQGNRIGFVLANIATTFGSTILVGNISGSTFAGDLTNALSNTDDVYASGFLVTAAMSNITIGNISDSVFTAGFNNIGSNSGTIFADGFSANSIIGGNIIVGNISNSLFAGGFNNTGFNNEANQPGKGEIWANGFKLFATLGNATIGNISNSTFTGGFNNAGLNNGEITANGFFAVAAGGSTNIGNISDSIFTGGFHNVRSGTNSGEVDDNGFWVLAADGNTTIGNIRNSIFTSGFHNDGLNEKMGKVSNAEVTVNGFFAVAGGGNITIGSVNNSIFASCVNNTWSNSGEILANGFMAFTPTGKVAIRNVVGNIFSSTFNNTGTVGFLNINANAMFLLAKNGVNTIHFDNITHNYFNYGFGAPANVNQFGIFISQGAADIDQSLIDQNNIFQHAVNHYNFID